MGLSGRKPLGGEDKELSEPINSICKGLKRELAYVPLIKN